MALISLLYHDVVHEHEMNSSGFRGPGPNSYKLTVHNFNHHLDAIQRIRPKVLTVDRCNHDIEPRDALLFHFDDGGSSAHSIIADELEQRGWRGHFYIATNYIGHDGFLTKKQIHDLNHRGHLIGSHSSSHPLRMAKLSFDEIIYEWTNSRTILEDILGHEISFASVPGGYYSTNIARAAAQVGIKVLFNSEPITSITNIEGVRVYGRYSIYPGTSAKRAAAFAAGRLLPRFAQSTFWNTKKFVKFVAGDQYLALRKIYMKRKFSS